MTKPQIETDTPALAFFGAHPIFRYDDFSKAYRAAGKSKAAARAIVQHHVRTGRLENVQRGVYRYLPAELDRFALGAQLTEDATIAYGSAVEFHRLMKTAAPQKTITVMTAGRIRDLKYGGHTYESVAPRAMKVGIAEYPGLHQPVRVTTPARTIADIIDRPELGPGLQHVFQILLNSTLNPWEIAEAASKLGRAQTAMRLAYLLSIHPRYAKPPASELEEVYRPKHAFYWDAETKRGGGRFVQRWNLIVPHKLFEQWHRDN
jgi:predicted transcriptional regulator of viral defense system